jgi:hypothetical protein
MLSVLTNLGDAFGGAGFEHQGYWFEGKLTQVSVSLSNPHHTPPNVEEG